MLALRELPNVIVIGESSYGILSDMLSRSLPNGWVITLSNELYVTLSSISYEGDGVPPDVYVPWQDGLSFEDNIWFVISTALNE